MFIKQPDTSSEIYHGTQKMNTNCVQSVNRHTKDTSHNADIMYKAYFPKTNNIQHSWGATRVLTFITQFHLQLLINSTIKSHNILVYSLSKLSQKIFTTRNFNTDGEYAEKKNSIPVSSGKN
jgi:hypothetical protein